MLPARSTVFDPLVPSGHLLGTARMGSDPAASVVDPFGRAHDVPNLFIVDGSVMVTGGGEPDIDHHGPGVAHRRTHCRHCRHDCLRARRVNGRHPTAH